jgi:hypothetical protein
MAMDTNEEPRCQQCAALMTGQSVGRLCVNCLSGSPPNSPQPERASVFSGRKLVLLSLAVVLLGALAVLAVVFDARKLEAQKMAASLRDTQLVGHTNARLHSLLIQMLRDQLEGFWLNEDRRTLSISSAQMAALSGLPMVGVRNSPSVENYSFGMFAGENPGSDWQRSASLLAHLQQLLTRQRGHPVVIDLKIFKFEEDYREALRTNGVVPMLFQ